MSGGRLRMSLTITATTADPAGQLQLRCRLVNMAGRIDTPAKCEFLSVILSSRRFGLWKKINVAVSCHFTTTTKSHSDFWSRPHS
ncbi:hypothetical protein AVEN_169956-1 [Araneus ventricosus]|uniref:Uncharacterized protein n=1 Tax=Araneus ventricosus TaxID=182803 RepID=A0A4Y2M0G7_ARAVE|nr:hypothetical protein AVEN_169956-1 [Araneus ventricosus]